MYRFSPSQLRNLLECPKCLWLKYRAGIERPRGIFPGLPGEVDRSVQRETAKYAGKSRPHWLLPDLKGKGIIKKGAKRMVAKGEHFVVTGIVDDIIVTDSGSAIIIDYKTARAPHSKEDTARYYNLQLDMYAFLCEANGLHVEDTAYIVYTTPHYLINFAYSDSFGFNFKVTHIALDVSAQRARDTIAQALKILALPDPPRASEKCEFCNYIAQRGKGLCAKTSQKETKKIYKIGI